MSEFERLMRNSEVLLEDYAAAALAYKEWIDDWNRRNGVGGFRCMRASYAAPSFIKPKREAAE